jgi:hypothetical protein
MASKTIDLNRSAASGSYIIGKIVCDATADNNLNNSDVTCRIYVHKGNDSTLLTIPTSGTWNYSMTINGKVFSGAVSKDVLLDWVLLATVSVSDIAHNDDGTKSIAISGWVTAPSGTSFSGHKTSGSGTFTLDTVPRASAIASAGNVTLGNACNVKWTPAAAAFRYKLKFSMGSWSYTTDAIHPNRKTSYTYTGYAIPLEADKQIPNSKTGTMTATLYTYSDAAATKQVGSADTETFTVTVPDNSNTKPAVSMTLSPVHSLPSAFAGLYIQGKSKVKAVLSATGKHEASIKSYNMKVEGISHGADDGYTSDYLTTYGSKPVDGYATDSRGITGSTSKSITVIAYSKPKISVSVCGRCDNNGNLTAGGTYLKIKATRNYSPVKSGSVQKNFCQIRYRYKTASAESYSAWTTILARDTLTSNQVETGALLGGVLAVDTSYMVQVQAVDDIGEYAETTINIPTDAVFMHRTKNAMGLGKYAEGENVLDMGWDIKMNGNMVSGLGAPSENGDAVSLGYLFNRHFLQANTAESIVFTGHVSALIVAQGPLGRGYISLLYQGYGVGGADRCHITLFQKGTDISYGILNAGASTHGLGIWNGSNVDMTVAVFPLTGTIVSITKGEPNAVEKL